MSKNYFEDSAKAALEQFFNFDFFLEYLTVGDKQVKVYEVNSDMSNAYTQAGFVLGEEITLTCRAADYAPHRGDKVFFRDEEYLVGSQIRRNAFNLSYTFVIEREN